MAGLSDLYTALNNIAQNLGRLIAQTALQIVVPITQGGTGATTASAARNNLGIFTGTPTVSHLAAFATVNSLEDGGVGGSYLVGSLIGADMNVTTDQQITINLPSGVTTWVLERVIASNPSISLTSASGGIYTGTGKTGLQLVPSSQVYSALTTNSANTAGSALLPTIAQTAMLTVPVVYLSLTAAQGVAATADFRIYAKPLF